MTGHEIRSKYLEFFRSKGHKVVASDSLVPKDDPTVLFTTAGMQQFKPQFMGHLTGFTRATSSQKCLRTDDLTEVGVTDFHHTMFEMLGNFSFGDYFKAEAIAWAWEFLTKVLLIPKDKLWVSVNKDDDEAYGIWLNEIKVPSQRIVKLGDKSNFWPSNARVNGPNGPCGPCSEIFFDWGKADCKDPACNPDCSCGRFCEVWNLVFTQYNRKDGGELEPLPAKNIDTGMGLERLTAVMQGKHNNFESDLFAPIMKTIAHAVNNAGAKITLRETRVMTDHVRAVTFGISDGVVPSNEGRGYVMRRLIVDMSNILLQAGIKQPLVHTFVAAVVDVMKGPYPELIEKQKDIVETIKRIEEAVIKLNAQKVPELIAELGKIKANAESVGELMFRYRDSYGLPLVLIQDKVLAQFGKEFLAQTMVVAERLMTEQKDRSRVASKMQGDVFLTGDVDVKALPKTEFLGYDHPAVDATILAIFVGGQKVTEAKDGDLAAIILDKTTFYAEQGGQAADLGVFQGKNGQCDIKDTQKISDVYVHRGIVTGILKSGEMVTAAIDGKRRMAVMRNHTATHLLQAALRDILGAHVKQQGSAVDQDRLRFDFAHPKAVTKEEILRIEDAVNAFVRRSDIIVKKEMTIDEAKNSGALAFFAEKYGDSVRVVSCGDYSKEFCGGTHLETSGQIGLFKIIAEGAVAQGVRRIEAVTGIGALAFVRAREGKLEKAAAVLKAPADELASRLELQVKKMKDLERQLANMNFEVIKSSIDGMVAKAQKAGGAVFVAEKFTNADMETLRRVSDLLRQKCVSVVALLAATSDEDGALILSVSEDLVKKGVNAGAIIKEVATLFGGSGGGRPNMAQAGTKEPGQLLVNFDKIIKVVKESVGS